jgi:hypothetical protein
MLMAHWSGELGALVGKLLSCIRKPVLIRKFPLSALFALFPAETASACISACIPMSILMQTRS